MIPATVAHALDIAAWEDEVFTRPESIQIVHWLGARYANARRTVCNCRTLSLPPIPTQYTQWI
jgi:hypothetical protein